MSPNTQPQTTTHPPTPPAHPTSPHQGTVRLQCVPKHHVPESRAARLLHSTVTKHSDPLTLSVIEGTWRPLCWLNALQNSYHKSYSAFFLKALPSQLWLKTTKSNHCIICSTKPIWCSSFLTSAHGSVFTNLLTQHRSFISNLNTHSFKVGIHRYRYSIGLIQCSFTRDPNLIRSCGE